MRFPISLALLFFIQLRYVVALDFTIAGGQIFTPGFAVLDAPQPGTPLGGDTLEVALDVSANGKLELPPYDDDSPSRIHNITIFMYSYETGRNFTVTNGTATLFDASLGDIMLSEPGSTVKHVRWTWPDCLIGDGQPDSADSDRGDYNISIRQNFRLNGEDHYTVFDVPISVTNSIEFSGLNPSCDALDNALLSPKEIDAEGANAPVGVLFAPGDATVIEQSGGGGDRGMDGNKDGGVDPGQVGIGAAADYRVGFEALYVPFFVIMCLRATQ